MKCTHLKHTFTKFWQSHTLSDTEHDHPPESSLVPFSSQLGASFLRQPLHQCFVHYWWVLFIAEVHADRFLHHVDFYACHFPLSMMFLRCIHVKQYIHTSVFDCHTWGSWHSQPWISDSICWGGSSRALGAFATASPFSFLIWTNCPALPPLSLLLLFHLSLSPKVTLTFCSKQNLEWRKSVTINGVKPSFQR